MIRPSASLSRIVSTAIAVLGSTSLLAAAALVAVTGDLGDSIAELRAGVESVRLAEESALHLLLHARAEDPLARTALEHDLRDGLARAAAFVTTDDEARILREAEARAAAYLAAHAGAEAEPLLREAFHAIEALASTNVLQARAAEGRARRWSVAGTAAAAAVSALLIGSAGWLLWWLRARAFRPVLAIAGAMERFGEGDTSARAPEAGPAELREISARFNRMAAALVALRERRTAFVAALAHELRNPLSALKLATGAPSPQAPERAAERLALVRRQVLRLERLLGDFVETARVEAGALSIRREQVDLRPIVEEVAALFAATSCAHALDLRLPGDPVVVGCDAGRIEQVLTNLVANAIKYSPAGGRVAISLEPRPGEVALAVSDEGVGIAEDELETIFEPFRRSRAPARDLPGTGLGLFASRRIVEAHGGRLLVSSRPGSGSTFEAVLPR